MVVFPNAKINLGLNIINRRPDGYHNIRTLMIPIKWCDILEITPSSNNSTTLTVTGRKIDCPTEKNIVMKAYNALAQSVDLPPVDIHLRKIIPDGAGLGGGSADASFTLKALNEQFNLGLTNEKLAEIAASIGADCPLFIYNCPMMATGTGTTLTPIDTSQLKGKSILIVKPQIHISTAQAYKAVVPTKPQQSIEQIINQPIDQWQALLVNDFESALATEFPEIEIIKNSLYQYGAIYASLSGSGSALYGIFESDKMAEEAKTGFSGMSTHITTL